MVMAKGWVMVHGNANSEFLRFPMNRLTTFKIRFIKDFVINDLLGLISYSLKTGMNITN